jgi:uncharacterized coiled-coil DUF342 family protein
MLDEDALSKKIGELEARKAELINRIKKLNARIRYKKYEQKALEPFLEETKDVKIAPLRKMKRALEFKIATAAYTPKMERDLLKEVKKVDKQLEEVREVERARRKKVLVEGDLKEAEAEILTIEEELKKLRDELRVLYGDAKVHRNASRQGVKYTEGGTKDDMMTLEEMGVVIEDNTKKPEEK